MDSRQMEDEILHLKAELELSRRETDELNTHLNCLTMLMKSAMSGDTAALSHLSEITGVQSEVVFKPKTASQSTSNQAKAIKNWTLLVTGVLHRDFKIKTKALKEQSVRELIQRSYYLDEVKETHDRGMKQVSFGNKSTGASTRPNRIQSAPVSSKKRETPVKTGLTAEAFFTLDRESHGNPSSNQTMAALQKTNSVSLERSPAADDRDYTNPGRYEQHGLFDAEPFVTRSRPVSAKSLVTSDANRARPKSSSKAIKTENTGRPLKYETTRPVSSKSRPPSKVGSTLDLNQHQYPNPPAANTRRSPDHAQPCQTFLTLSSVPSPGKTERDRIDRFAEELRRQDDMERKFQETTLSLQKKLGIRPDGLITK